MIIPFGNKQSDDNICKIVMDNDCSKCTGCDDSNNYFELNQYDGFFTITYYQKIGNIVIHQSSERIKGDFINTSIEDKSNELQINDIWDGSGD